MRQGVAPPDERLNQAIDAIASGIDLDRSLPVLRQDRTRAIAHLLAALSGSSHVNVAGQTHPRDAHDHLLGALAILASEDVDHRVALLRDALDANESAHAFPLAWTLAQLKRPVAVDVLMSALASRDPFVRWAACDGLRRLRARRARSVLNRAAADRHPLVRGKAVDALRQLGDESSLAVLRKRLGDRYPGIRVAARRAIDAIDKRTA